MPIGTVKWFDATKGYGFVIPNDGGPDIYLHAKALDKAKIGAVEPGAVVEYSASSRSGKAFVDGVAIVSAVPPPPAPRAVEKKTPLTSAAEDEFDREWGLRRA
jgi:CspA family cold shock protein